jgi:Lipocalin-like domain
LILACGAGASGTGISARARLRLRARPRALQTAQKENTMNRLSILTIAAMTALGLSVLSGSVVAQQNTLKEQLVGTWTLVTSDQVRSDGTKLKQFGPSPTGVNVFETNGRFFILVASSDNVKMASNDSSKASSEEDGRLISESMAYYGTYTVNEVEKVVMLHLEASTFPNLVGTDQKRIITSLTADELKYTNPAAVRGLQVHQVWKRAE